MGALADWTCRVMTTWTTGRRTVLRAAPSPPCASGELLGDVCVLRRRPERKGPPRSPGAKKGKPKSAGTLPWARVKKLASCRSLRDGAPPPKPHGHSPSPLLHGELHTGLPGSDGTTWRGKLTCSRRPASRGSLSLTLSPPGR